MTSAKYCRMGEFEDVGMVGEVCKEIVEDGCNSLLCLFVDLLEVGEPLGVEWDVMGTFC